MDRKCKRDRLPVNYLEESVSPEGTSPEESLLETETPTLDLMGGEERDELFYRMRNHVARRGRARPIQLESMTREEIEVEKIMKAEKLRDNAKRFRKNKREKMENLEDLVKRQRTEIKEKNRRIHDLEHDLKHYKELADKLLSQINPVKSKQETVTNMQSNQVPQTRNTVQVFFPHQQTSLSMKHLDSANLPSHFQPMPPLDSANLPTDLQSIQVHSDFHTMDLPIPGDFQHSSFSSQCAPSVATGYYNANRLF